MDLKIAKMEKDTKNEINNVSFKLKSEYNCFILFSKNSPYVKSNAY